MPQPKRAPIPVPAPDRGHPGRRASAPGSRSAAQPSCAWHVRPGGAADALPGATIPINPGARCLPRRGQAKQIPPTGQAPPRETALDRVQVDPPRPRREMQLLADAVAVSKVHMAHGVEEGRAETVSEFATQGHGRMTEVEADPGSDGDKRRGHLVVAAMLARAGAGVQLDCDRPGCGQAAVLAPDLDP